MPIRPLTHGGQDGQPYHRRPEIQAQIAATAELPASELVRRAALADANDAEYLRDETLVYHLRNSAMQQRDALLNQLWEPFQPRLTRFAQPQLKSLPRPDQEDAHAELSLKVLELFRKGGDRADYCEVSFRNFVKLRATDLYNQKIAHINRTTRELRSIDERDYDESGPPGEVLRADDWNEDTSIANLTAQALLRELQAAFAGDLRPYQAVLLRRQGLPIGPAGAPGTIATHFGVTDRTIRNWFGKVRTFVVDWQKRESK